MKINLRKIKDDFASILGGILLLFGVWLSLFHYENWHIIIYSVLFYGVGYLFASHVFKYTCVWWVNLIAIFLVYFVLQSLFRCSPYLQLKEFEWTHPQWQRVAEVQIFEAEAYKTGRKAAFSAMNVIYEYQFNQQAHVAEQEDIGRQYTLFVWDNSSSEMSRVKFAENLANKKNVVLVNTAKPEQSIYFSGQEYFDIRSSWLSHFIYIGQLLLVVMLIIVPAIFFNGKIKTNKTFQSWSKPKQNAFVFMVIVSVFMGLGVVSFYLLYL